MSTFFLNTNFLFTCVIFECSMGCATSVTKMYRIYTHNPPPIRKKPKTAKVCKTSGYADPFVAILLNEVRVTAVYSDRLPNNQNLPALHGTCTLQFTCITLSTTGTSRTVVETCYSDTHCTRILDTIRTKFPVPTHQLSY